MPGSNWAVLRGGPFLDTTMKREISYSLTVGTYTMRIYPDPEDEDMLIIDLHWKDKDGVKHSGSCSLEDLESAIRDMKSG